MDRRGFLRGVFLAVTMRHFKDLVVPDVVDVPRLHKWISAEEVGTYEEHEEFMEYRAQLQLRMNAAMYERLDEGLWLTP